MFKNKTFKNSLYSALYQILILFVPLATTPYVTRIFTVEQLGIYAASLALVSFFVILASFGLPLYGSREIAKCNNNNRQLLFTQFFFFQIITSVISFFLYLITLQFIGANKFYYLQSFLIIVNILDVSWFFIGIEEIKRTLLRNFLSRLFILITIFIFVKSTSDLDKYIFLNVLGTLIGNITMILQLKKFLKGPIVLKFINYSSVLECFNLFIPQILSSSKNTFDRLILLYITGNNSYVGLYDQSKKLINIIVSISNSATTAILPKMTSLNAQNKNNQFYLVIDKVLPILGIFSVFLTSGLFINADLFVSLFFGSEFLQVSTILKYMSVTLLVIPLNYFIYNAILLPISEDNTYRNILTLNFIVIIVGNFILDFKFGVIGATISFIFSEYLSIMYCIHKLRIKHLKKKILLYVVLCVADSFFTIYSFQKILALLGLNFYGSFGLLVQILLTTIFFIIVHLFYILILVLVKKVKFYRRNR
ncbi:oligosaccharide flippase family protein [Enterococcus mundtii]|uniref:Polysaccharide biosynthesis protein C-terminal domain-containing protein n=1 Tax=Enterococcus mundtii TaxID=53346 RepID=A0A242L1C6_ENTMU|nr:oligosaccharide flippase family protein [Enterococcus mundtii]OTP27620.1 hypothetical protein A5802_001355 [Enterococcus mundtii]